MGEPARRSGPVVCVGASSKKAGKSRLATFLVRNLSAVCAIKVSAGGDHLPEGEITTDPDILRLPETDTGRLAEAGAETVLWVHASAREISGPLRRAIGMIPDDCVLVIEGNSAIPLAEADLSIFLVGAPVRDFKPSAYRALPFVDLLLVELPAAGEMNLLEEELRSLSPRARILFYADSRERERAYAEALEEAKRAVAAGSERR